MRRKLDTLLRIAGAGVIVAAPLAQASAAPTAFRGLPGALIIRALTPPAGLYAVDPVVGLRPLPGAAFSASQLAVSPDGGEIAYVSRGSGRAELAVAPLAGGVSRVLRVAEGAGRMDPAWSPDSAQIAYTVLGPLGEEIRIINADGTGDHRAAGPGIEYQTPQWLPDGTGISYISSRDRYGVSGDIYLAQFTDRRPLRLTKTRDVLPMTGYSWSPDATTIVASRYVDPIQSHGSRLVLIRRPGRTSHQPLPNLHRPPGQVWDIAPLWSPAGTEIVFSRSSADCDPLPCASAPNASILSARFSTNDVEKINGSPAQTVDWQSRCSQTGTAADDVLHARGTRPVVCGVDGDDKIVGASARAVLSGGRGNDLLVAGPASDWIFGGLGNDRIIARNNRPDIVSCGPGRDTVLADRSDRIMPSCESVRR